MTPSPSGRVILAEEALKSCVSLAEALCAFSIAAGVRGQTF